MKYIVATFTITCPDELLQTARDLIADAAAEVGFESFEDTPQGLLGYVQDHLFDADELRKGLDNLGLPGVSVSFTTAPMEDKNWNELWEQEGFAPILIAHKVLIFDARKPQPQLDEAENAVAIGIEATQAFGTGTHETTRLVIEAMLDLPQPPQRLLDCGCGTGILGIAAAKLGAAEVVGYDIDEWSVDNARHNATLNQVNNMEVLLGDSGVLSHVSGFFDVVVANINRNILLNDMHAFHDVMAAGATLILSGFYTDDVPLLVEKAAEYGLKITAQTEENRWACITLR